MAKGRPKRAVYIDGARYDTLREAAKAAGLAESSLAECLRYGSVMVNGHRLSEEPDRAADPFPPPERKHVKGAPLLRYPPGEGPGERGVGRVWR